MNEKSISYEWLYITCEGITYPFAILPTVTIKTDLATFIFNTTITYEPFEAEVKS